MSSTTTRVMLIGAGPLGLKVAGYVIERSNLALVGIVDLNPDLSRRQAGELVRAAPPEVVVTASLDEAIGKAGPAADVAVVTTVSSIREILPTIKTVAERKLNIVTTCEELQDASAIARCSLSEAYHCFRRCGFAGRRFL